MTAIFSGQEFHATIQGPRTWASRNGYACKTMLLRPEWGPDSLPQELTGAWEMARQVLCQGYRSPPLLIDARDCAVLLWKWLLPRGGQDELLVSFARDGSLLSANPFWVKYFPFVKNLSSQHECDIDLRDAERQHLEGDFFLLGGRNNWSHWLVDFLPYYSLVEAFGLTGTTLVTPKLNAWQRESLECLGIRQKILEINPSRQKGLFSFSRLFVADGFPLPARVRWLRRRCLPQHREPPEAGWERIYLSRANLAPRHRVANETEVQALLNRHGFRVVFAEELSMSEKIRRFYSADIIATAPGSNALNFVLFGSEKTLCLNLSPSFMGRDTPMDWVLGGLMYLVPALDRTAIIYGRRPSNYPHNHNIDVPEIYPLDGIERALAACESRLASSR